MPPRRVGAAKCVQKAKQKRGVQNIAGKMNIQPTPAEYTDSPVHVPPMVVVITGTERRAAEVHGEWYGGEMFTREGVSDVEGRR